MQSYDSIILTCPICGDYLFIYLTDINCGIFRHAVYKNTLINIDPHESKEKCELLIKTGQVYGCASPFRVIHQESVYIAIKCDYI